MQAGSSGLNPDPISGVPGSQPLVLPDPEPSAERTGKSSLQSRFFKKLCSDFHSLLCCQDNPELRKSLCVDFPQNSTVCHHPEDVWWRGLSQLPGFSHKFLGKCQKFSLVSKHYQWEKEPKRTRKAALRDGRFSNSCFNKALILIKASSILWSLLYQRNQKKGSQCFQFLFCPASPAPQEVKINNQ